MSGHIIVMTAVSSEEEASRIGRALVERRLAACVNRIGPVRSIYKWKGEIKDEPELVLLIKTVRENFPRLQQTIGELHSYELPEIVAVPIELGDETYLNWITAHCSDEPQLE